MVCDFNVQDERRGTDQFITECNAILRLALASP